MRELTFRGFLTQYVKQLSKQDTNSLFKLASEAALENPRLKEPLLLYAVYTQKQGLLLRAARELPLYEDYRRILEQYPENILTQLLATHSPELPVEYQKVWNSYMSCKNRVQSDNQTKELMRQKVKRVQQKSGVTNYRIYTDLRLNPGNVNAWLKHGDCEKVSLNTARIVLQYVQRN